MLEEGEEVEFRNASRRPSLQNANCKKEKRTQICLVCLILAQVVDMGASPEPVSLVSQRERNKEMNERPRTRGGGGAKPKMFRMAAA